MKCTGTTLPFTWILGKFPKGLSDILYFYSSLDDFRLLERDAV